MVKGGRRLGRKGTGALLTSPAFTPNFFANFFVLDGRGLWFSALSSLSQPYVAPKKEMIRLLLNHPQHTLDLCHHFLGSLVWSTLFLVWTSSLRLDLACRSALYV